MPESEISAQQTDSINPAAEELAFDKAEFENPEESEFSCSVCKNPIRENYFRAGEAVLCSSCRWAAEAEDAKPKPGGPRRFTKAFAYGLGGAVAGTAIYLAVLWGTGYEVGLISILVGWLVGKAVYKGSGETGGRRYQVMAVALTYFSICASYAPLIVKGMIEEAEKDAAQQHSSAPLPAGSGTQAPEIVVRERNGAEAVSAAPAAESTATAQPEVIASDSAVSEVGALSIAVGLVFILGLSLVAPFLAGFENILGLAIIAFGLFEAWKHAGARAVVYEGPYSVGE